MDGLWGDRTEGAMFLLWMFLAAAASEVADNGVCPVGIDPTGGQEFSMPFSSSLGSDFGIDSSESIPQVRDSPDRGSSLKLV